MGGRVDLQREVELRRHERAGRLAEPEHLGLVDRVAIDGDAGRLPHAAVVPGRLGVPLIQEVEPVHAVQQRRLDGDPRRALEILGHRPAEEVGDVHLAGLHGDRPRGLVGDAPHDQVLHRRLLAPVVGEGFELELVAGADLLLVHAPNHLAAAATLVGHPIEDIFEVGVPQQPPEET